MAAGGTVRGDGRGPHLLEVHLDVLAEVLLVALPLAAGDQPPLLRLLLPQPRQPLLVPEGGGGEGARTLGGVQKVWEVFLL